MKDQTETPLTETNFSRPDITGAAVEAAAAGRDAGAPSVADLQAELASLRQLIRRQDAVVGRLLSERAVPDRTRVEASAETPKRGKRSTRRGLLTQLAAGAAGVAAAAVYGTTQAGSASAEFHGTVVGPSTAQQGIFAYPNGVTPITSAKTAGVWGQRDNSAPDPNSDAGVIGISNSAKGVVGQSNLNDGVYGFTNATNAAGVQGFSFSAGSPGVVGGNLGSGGIGVKGVGGSGTTARGVHGTASAGYGVFGESDSNGTGVRGESVSGPGVYGKSTSQPGVDGVSTNSLGLRGTSTNFVGIVGISTNSHGLYGSSASPSNYGIIAENTVGGPGLYVTGSAFINGSLQVTGAKNAVVKMPDGTDGVVYCQEAPEPYFEDFGRARLVNGVAQVSLEREFAALVSGADYMVFSFPQGDTKGLYVSRQDANGFEVREVQGGASNVSFTYRIVTRRKDIEGKRFARVSHEAADKIPGIRAALAAMDRQPGPGGR